jgi:hypothetical protein
MDLKLGSNPHLSVKICDSDCVFRVTQYRLISAPRRCDASGRGVYSLLKHVTRMSACPFPTNDVRFCGTVQPLPPREICLASKATVHRFDDISRVSKHAHLARLPQRFESNRGRSDLSLLVCRSAQKFTDSAPDAFVTKQRHCRCATCDLPVAKTRAVAVDGYLLELFLFVCHS